jgi:hypothetical protein
MRAFIIRPFGVKKDKSGFEIDFEKVDEQLISPALAALQFEGRTTQEIAKAGNIRMDMFRLLVTADLVVADLSIHNANVFYELGIRHALRDKRTFLIRCKADETIFDLQTDRYLLYDRDKPGDSLDELIRGLRQTRDSTIKDSPVFLLLPELQVQRRSLFLTVPQDFGEEVERAAAERRIGDLELLGEEARGFEWESEGLRVVGRAQFNLKAWEGARVTWEAVRELEGEDLEANTLLGTVYQRLGDLTRSDQAVRRALERPDARPYDRAELRSLLGRNAKARWTEEWRKVAAENRREQALRSSWLEDSAREYADGFADDLNHFYSGLNALAMLTVMAELAGALPEVWAERFLEPEEPARELKARSEHAARLAAAVDLSLRAAQRRLEREQKKDVWVAISAADLRCLTLRAPPQVAHAYRQALAGAADFAVEAARAQLELYRDLGVRADNVQAALAALPPVPAPAAEKEPVAARPRVLLFTGHMVDAPGREQPRFPPDKEGVARQAIRDAIAEEMAEPGGVACGIAGGASGGDTLFHEVCAELGVGTELYLALPRDQFVAASVAPAGPAWVERFARLYERLPRRVLADGKELPRWLREKPDYGIWQRNNLWTLHNGLALGRDKVTLIALWDGGAGDGPGGTQDMVTKAEQRGAKTVILNTKKLFGLGATN